MAGTTQRRGVRRGSRAVTRLLAALALAVPGAAVLGARTAAAAAASVQAWGSNEFGQIGDGTTTSRSTPLSVALPDGVRPVALSAGFYQSFVVGDDGVVYAWGRNDIGEIGDGTTTDRSAPVAVHVPGGAVVVAGGGDHALAITAAGGVMAWGDNFAGKLGIGSSDAQRNDPTPVTLPGGIGAVAVAAGGNHSLAIGTDGRLYAWGGNGGGQVGDGTTTNRSVPTAVLLPAGVTATAIAASPGSNHSLAIGSDGKVYAWGDNQLHELGDGTSVPFRSTPVALTLPGGAMPLRIAAGADISFAYASDGHLYGWGDNLAGELGDGTFTSRPTPTASLWPVGTALADLSAGAYHVVALAVTGQVYGWGQNDHSQVGDGTTSNRSTPTPVALAGGAHVSAVAAGGQHGLAADVTRRTAQSITFASLADRTLGDAPVPLTATASSGLPVTFSSDTPAVCSLVLSGGAWSVELAVVGTCAVRASQAGDATYAPATEVVRSFLVAARVSSAGELTAVTPARILDTRVGTGGFTSPLGPQQPIDVQITGRGGVPSAGVSAVVMNVTATEATAETYVTVWPTGLPRPVISNLNVVAGQTVPNLVTVKVGAAGRVSAFNFAGSTHLLFDVVAFYADDTGPHGARFHSVDPSRRFDTRDGNGGVPAATLTPGSELVVDVRGRNAVPADGVTAVVLNVTVVAPSAPGYVTVYPAGGARPIASNLNFVAGQTVPNLVTVGVGAAGVAFYVFGATTDLIADVVGYYDGAAVGDAGRFVGLAPSRAVDTRLGFGPLGPREGGILTVAGYNGVPIGAPAAVLNVTVTETTGPSFLAVFPDDACTLPLVSNLNWVAGQTVPNLVVARLSIGVECSEGPGKVVIYNRASSTQVIVDVFGYFSA